MKQLLDLPNVVAVGRGYKQVGGEKTDITAVVASVVVKLPMEALAPEDVVPPEIDGMPTDVIETGVIRAFERTTRERPALGGDSIGHYAITAGTLGVVLRRLSDGARVILSNNHVLANSNEAQIGDAILQPGAHDGGTPERDTIATLADFVPVQFGGGLPSPCRVGGVVVGLVNAVSFLVRRRTRLVSIFPAGENLVDAAIALSINDADVSDEIRGIGFPIGTLSAELGDPLIKSGRTTEVTTGKVEQVDVTVQVQYGEGKIAVFTDQIMAGAMSAPGDSGSAVLSDEFLVGLLFAGSETTTIINRIEHVFTALGLSLSEA